MSKILWRALVVLFFVVWFCLDVIGRLEVAKNLVEHRAEWLKTMLYLASILPVWTPVAALALLLITWICIEAGCFRPNKVKANEDRVYYSTVNGKPGHILGEFLKSGGADLSNDGIKRVCKRLIANGFSPFGVMQGRPDLVKRRDWARFFKRAREVGRNLEGPSNAVSALEEWQQTRDLTPY